MDEEIRGEMSSFDFWMNCPFRMKQILHTTTSPYNTPGSGSVTELWMIQLHCGYCRQLEKEEKCNTFIFTPHNLFSSFFCLHYPETHSTFKLQIVEGARKSWCQEVCGPTPTSMRTRKTKGKGSGMELGFDLILQQRKALAVVLFKYSTRLQCACEIIRPADLIQRTPTGTEKLLHHSVHFSLLIQTVVFYLTL